MSARRVSPVLVGCEAEVDVLEDAFEAAAGGAPHVVLLGAEAGGGKSRPRSAPVRPTPEGKSASWP